VEYSEHGDAFLRRAGMKHSIRIKNTLNKKIRVTILPKKPNRMISSIQFRNIGCINIGTNYDDMQEQVFDMDANMEKKIKVDTHNMYVSIEINGKILWNKRKMSCSYDIYIMNSHLNELFEKSLKNIDTKTNKDI